MVQELWLRNWKKTTLKVRLLCNLWKCCCHKGRNNFKAFSW